MDETDYIVPRERQALLLAASASDNPVLRDAVDALLVTAILAGLKPAHPFVIGDEFTFNDHRWRVTDVGIRTILAIDLSRYDNDPSWFNGPPYAIPEVSFDEYEISGCELITCEI